MISLPIPGLPAVAWRWIAILTTVAATAITAWVKGAAHVQADFDRFEASVTALGKAQAARATAINQARTTITRNIEADYEKGNSALRALYPAPGGLRHPDTRSCPLPGIPSPAPGPDGPASDPGPGAGLPAPDPDECTALRADAAVATRQLLYLQAWVAQQAGVEAALDQ